MTLEDSESKSIESVVNSATEKVQDLPASSSAEATEESSPASDRHRLFNRQRSVHQVLGGGKAADSMLWRSKRLSAVTLAGATITWCLFENSGFTVLAIASDVLIVLIVGLFAWSNAAVFIRKSSPRIPELQLSEDMVVSFASALRIEINKALAVAHDIALGKDFVLFLKVFAVLWGLSVIGGLFHFLTFLYICILFSHTVPVIYERYEDQIDSYAKVAMDEARIRYRTVNGAVASQFSKVASKEKKAQ